MLLHDVKMMEKMFISTANITEIQNKVIIFANNLTEKINQT